MIKNLCKSLILFSLVFFLFSCKGWMDSDDFFEEIDQEVFVANAEKINVYVRYAVTTQGTTTPSGSAVFKVDVVGDISCVTNTSYGFHHWAAFSNEFFNTQEQNKNIIYESGEGAYDDTILEYELGEEDITFGDKFSPSTTVKIHTNRNDIVLVPVVGARPTIDRLSPTLNQAGVIRNTSLRYLFTKKMDLSSFNSDNITIKSGYAVMTDQEIVSDDITSKFIWSNPDLGTYSPVRSVTGKMVTFRLRPGDTLGSNQQITINLSNSIKDEDGYEMESDQRIYFTTGTSVDSLAPIIQELTCGTDDKFATFGSIQFNGDEIKNEGAIKSLNDPVFNPHIEHRVKNKINIYLYATDIGGEGVNASVVNVDEEAVSLYGVRAKVLYAMNGELSDAAIGAVETAYIPNGNDIPVKTSDDMNNRGYAFSYDLSGLPDGLIGIDVWTMDNVGNNGLDEPYYATYDNGYRTLLVVKDTSAPNASVEKNKVISKSDKAIYGWYNESTLDSTFVMVADNESINDSGHERLRAKANKIKWIFAVGDDPLKWTPSASDAGWKVVTDGAYSLGEIKTSREGPIGILMALIDESGNMSETVILDNTVLSDLTSPQAQAPSWVDANGNPARSISKNIELQQYLKVPFTETLSGVREVTIDVNSVNGIQSGVTKFYYNEIKAESEIPYTISTRNEKTCAVLTPPQSKAGFESGTLFVTGINIGEFTEEGSKVTTVVLYDAALNNSNSVSAALVYDKTAPAVQSVSAANVVPDEKGRRWLKNSSFSSGKPNNASIVVTATEATSGIEVISLRGAKLTSASKVYSGETAVSCSVNTSAGTITLENSVPPALASASQFAFTITGVEFTDNIDNGKPNTISVQLTDFAGNTQTSTASDSIYIDAKSPAAPSIKISDREKSLNDAYWTWDGTKHLYTNSNAVDIVVTLSGNADTESGITSLTFSNVQFDSGTTVSSGTASGSTITFANMLYGNQTITISNAKLTESNKKTTVSISATDFVSWTSTAGSYAITHDSTAPSFSGEPYWLSASGDKNITSNFGADNDLQLFIPYSDSVSGIKAITISNINSISGSSISIKNDNQTISAYKLGENYITFTEPLAGKGVLSITGLTKTVNSEDNDYPVSIVLCDAAENKYEGNNGDNIAKLCVDVTNPQLHKVVVPNVRRIKYYGETPDNWHYYFAKDDLNSRTTDVILYITETTSGIRTVEFSGNIKPTSKSRISIQLNDTSINSSNFSVSDGKITFNVPFEIKGTNFALRINGCSISDGDNALSVKVTDFASLESETKTAGTYRDNNGAETTVDNIIILSNNKSAQKPSLILKDRGTGDTDYDLLDADVSYTNYGVINATVNIPDMSASTNSTRKIKIDGASFVTSGNNSYNSKSNVTEVKIGDDILSSGTDYKIEGDTITFEKAFNSAVTIALNNIELPSVDGEKTVKIISYPPTDCDTSPSSIAQKITLDTEIPNLKDDGPYAVDGSDIKSEYPRYEFGLPVYGFDSTFDGSGTPDKNSDGKPIHYFYTKNSERNLEIELSEINRVSENGICIVNSLDRTSANASEVLKKSYLPDSYISGEKMSITVNAQDPADKPYTYIIRDRAGNVSKAHSFYVIQDNTPPIDKVTSSGDDSITSRIVINLPQNKSVHRNPNAAGVIDYIISETAAGEEYKITVKLNGISNTDTLVDGEAASSSTVKYEEINPTKTQSGLASWAITRGSDVAPTSGWTDYTGGDITFIIDEEKKSGLTTYEPITLHLKDNCGNINSIPVCSPDQKNLGTTIKWQIDNKAPNVKNSYPASELLSGSGVSGTYSEGSGTKYGRTYVSNNTTYFNSKAYLGITCDDEVACLFDGTDDSIKAAASIPEKTNYTIKARLYYTDGENSTLANDKASADFITAANSNDSFVSDWYYFAGKTSAGKTFYLPYPNRGEGNAGRLYLLLVDTVGNTSVTEVTNGTVNNKFCYNDESATISQPATLEALVPADANRTIHKASGVTTVYSGTKGPVEFNITITPPASGIAKYKYSVSENDTDTTDYTLSSDVSKTIPVTLLKEAGSDAIAEPIYLYIYDNVGNLSVTKIGNTTWLKDGAAPKASSWGSKVQSNENNSYIKQTGADGELDITIAGLSEGYKNADSSYPVYIPVSWFVDSGSGLLGLSCEKENLNSLPETKTKAIGETNCFVLNIPKSAVSNKNYYVYDKVGNCKEYSFTSKVDDSAPEVGAHFYVENSGNNRLYSKDLYKADREKLFNESLFDASTGYKGNADENRSAYTETLSTPQAVSQAKELYSTIADVYLELETSDTGGISLIRIRKSTDGGTNFSAITGGEKTNDDSGKTAWGITDTEKFTLKATAPATLYEIYAKDFAGNVMTHYVYLQLDSTAPEISSATVTPNAQARTKTVDGKVTLYYNPNYNSAETPLKFSATISDKETADGNGDKVGLGAYKFDGDNFTNTNPAVLNKNYTAGTENDAETISLVAHDLLGNEKTIDKWKLSDGTTVEQFVLDKTAPEWSNADSEMTLERYGLVSGWGDWQKNTPDSNALVEFKASSGNEGTIYVKSGNPADIIIKPSASDGSGSGIGYIIQGNNTSAPVITSSTKFRDSFLIVCSPWETNALYSGATGERTTGDWISNDSNRADIKFLTANGSASFPFYIYPVDYAGNVGEPIKITLVYQGETPVIKNDDFGITPASAHFYQDLTSKVNYFRGTGTATGSELEDNTEVTITAKVSVKNPSESPVKGFKIVKKNSSFTQNGQNGKEYIDVVKHEKSYGTSGYTDNTRTFNVKMPFGLLDAATDTTAGSKTENKYNYTGDDLYIVFYNDKGDSEPKKLEYNGSAKWALDNAAPATPTSVTLGNSEGFHLKEESSGYTLFYKESTGSTNLIFDNAEDTGTIKSGYKGVGTSTTDEIKNPYPVPSTSLSDGERTFYAYDNVLNASSGVSIKYTKDGDAPEITGVAVDAGTGFLSDASSEGTHKYYFNAAKKDVSTYNVSQITLTVSANDGDGSGIKEYSCVTTNGVEASVAGNIITLSNLKYDGNGWDVTIYIEDYVGNKSSYPIIFVPDGAAPEIKPTFTYSDTRIGNIADGETVYFKLNTSITAPAITFKSNDNGGSSGSADVDITSVTYEYTPTPSGSFSNSIATEDGVSTKVNVEIADKVNNKSSFEITFIADGSAPNITGVTVDTGDNDNFLFNASSGDTHKYYFNAAKKDVSTYNVSQIKLVVSATGDDISSYSCDVDVLSGVAAAQDTDPSKSNEFTLTGLKYDGTGWDATIKVKDRVDNEATYTITFVPDSAGPSLKSGKAGVKLANGDATDGKVYNVPDTTTYYYNASKNDSRYILSGLSFTLTADDFEDEDTGSGIKEYIYVIGTDKTDISLDIYNKFVILLTDEFTASQQTINVYAVDNVGNRSDSISFTVIPDGAPPTTAEGEPIVADDGTFTFNSGSGTWHESVDAVSQIFTREKAHEVPDNTKTRKAEEIKKPDNSKKPAAKQKAKTQPVNKRQNVKQAEKEILKQVQDDKHVVQDDKLTVQSDKLTIQADRQEVQTDNLTVQDDKLAIHNDRQAVQNDTMRTHSESNYGHSESNYSHSELVSESISESFDDVELIANVPLAENRLFEYNQDDGLLVDSDSSRLSVAICAAAVAFAAGIALAVILLLKKRRMNK